MQLTGNPEKTRFHNAYNQPYCTDADGIPLKAPEFQRLCHAEPNPTSKQIMFAAAQLLLVTETKNRKFKS